MCAREASAHWRRKERESYNEYQREYSGKRLDLIEKYLRDENEIWFDKRTRQRRRLKQATPPWASRVGIRHIYKECLRISHSMYMVFEVDHIIPLSGKKVCGLHTPENLRVISRSLNDSKGNKFNYNKESRELLKWLKERGL